MDYAWRSNLMVAHVPPKYVASMFVAIAIGAAAGVVHAAEPPYPSRPIRLVIGLAPGGAGDALARIISPKLNESMGQAWVVDNRSGAAGNLATDIVARANPDGHTVLIALNSQLTMNPSLYKLSFNVEKDLQPITMLATVDQVLIVHPSVPVKTLKEFVALAKQKPGALNFGSSGVGSVEHIGAVLLQKRTGIEMTHVAYKGGAPRNVGLLAGEVQVNISSVAASIAYTSAGRLRVLAIASRERSRLMPDVPTIAESGYPGYEVNVWWALLAPGATPQSIAERIRGETAKVLQSADVQSAMERLGLNPVTSTQAELAARIKAESAMFAGLIKEAKIDAQ